MASLRKSDSLELVLCWVYQAYRAEFIRRVLVFGLASVGTSELLLLLLVAHWLAGVGSVFVVAEPRFFLVHSMHRIVAHQGHGPHLWGPLTGPLLKQRFHFFDQWCELLL